MRRERAVLMARPSRYDPSTHPSLAERLCLTGATDADLAMAFEVCESTINNWKQKHREFSDSMTRGKAVADAAVVKALYERALGYRIVVKKTVRKASQRVVGGSVRDFHEVIETTTEVFIPPDVTACIFWLKNRDPQRWRDRPAEGDGSSSQDGIRAFLEATTPSKEQVAALFGDQPESG